MVLWVFRGEEGKVGLCFLLCGHIHAFTIMLAYICSMKICQNSKISVRRLDIMSCVIIQCSCFASIPCGFLML